LHYKIIGAPKKLKKGPVLYFRPETNHTPHQKPNPSRETVSLRIKNWLIPIFLLDCLGESKLSNPAPIAVSTAPRLYWISLDRQHQAHRSIQVTTNFELFLLVNKRWMDDNNMCRSEIA
jgi:hypothetical protein